MWKARIQFYWTQRFPARSAVRVRHTYRPFVGGSYITTGMDGASNIRPYCGGPETLTEIQRVKLRRPRKDAETVLLERNVQYILTTANNWNGPIHNFHLTVTADDPEDIVLTCMPGLERTSPTRYELSRTDFHPDRELDLLILQAAR